MKQVNRPWDGSWQAQLERAEKILAVPSVTLGDITYKSDRFYLHAVEGDSFPLSAAAASCTCGSQQPPPIFYRERFVNSLQLKAAIIGTYTVDLKWASQAFPQLVGPTSSVPTLILHGQKGRKGDFAGNATRNTNGNSSDSSQPDKISSASPMTPNLMEGNSDLPENVSFQFGNNLHLTQILTAWLPQNNEVTKEIAQEIKLETKLGVHHPKFMLLFETSGDLVVIISTANLTRTKTTEGSWVQRFRRCQRPDVQRAAASVTLSKNDFGPVLTDFLTKVSTTAVEGQMRIDAFLQTYLSFRLKELKYRFFFDKAQVHLVPVIPGEWKDQSKFLYGRQRVRYLLLQQQKHLLVAACDRLVCQPTSLGGSWTRGEMADLVRTYLALDTSFL